MKRRKILSFALALALTLSLCAAPALAVRFTDAHGNVIELDDSLEAYTQTALAGADDAARKGETNLGDLWTDALRWFAVSGKINGYFDEDDVKAGNTKLAVDADHTVALWNGGNLRADIPAGTFGAEELAQVLPYPNKVAVVYMTGAQLLEALEAASQGLPYTEGSAAAAASFMQVSGLSYTVRAYKSFDRGEVYKDPWYKAKSVQRVSIESVNGKAFDAQATYAVITSNANYNGMDSSYVFKAAAEEHEKSAVTTAVVRDVVWMYLAEKLSNVVGSEYAQPQGRILVLDNPFRDVRSDAWCVEPVTYMLAKGYMKGTSATTFTPNATMTRAQAVVVLYRIAGSPAVKTEGTKWYAAAAQWAADQGIFTSADLDGAVTREELAVMLYRYEIARGGDVRVGEDTNILSYTDADQVTESAIPAIQWACGAGILRGDTSGALKPAASATRAHMAALFARFCQR